MTLIGNSPNAPTPCEAKGCRSQRSTHIYGPECEATSGKLMYLCWLHASQIAGFIAAHPNDPVDCPEHGTIGRVKEYLILKEM